MRGVAKSGKSRWSRPGKAWGQKRHNFTQSATALLPPPPLARLLLSTKSWLSFGFHSTVPVPDYITPQHTQ